MPNQRVECPLMTQSRHFDRHLRHQFGFDFALEGMLRVGRVAHTGINLGAVIQDAARVGERLETPPVDLIFGDVMQLKSGAERLESCRSHQSRPASTW